MVEFPVYEPPADGVRHLYLNRDTDNSVAPHFHNSMELLFVSEGRHFVSIGGEDKTLSPGEIAVSDSYDIHRYEHVENSTVYIAVIAQRFLHDFRAMSRNNTFQKFLPVSDGTREIFTFVKNAYDGNIHRNDLLAQGFVTYLMGLLVKYYPVSRERGEGDERGVRILRYINDHYTEDLKLSALAERFGYTPNYFSSLFNGYTGLGLRDYINRLRIQHAAKLNDGTRKTAEIAAQCGFDSLNTYYRALKKFDCSRENRHE